MRLEGRESLKLRGFTQRYMVRGLGHEFLFDKAYVEDFVCQDESDQAILEELRGAGVDGLLPQDLSCRLGSRRLLPWKTTKRIYHINNRLEKLIDQKNAEKRGMQWALTSFMSDAWGSTKNEIVGNPSTC
jgi:hypothetical protein